MAPSGAQERRAETRDKILAAAADVFAERGFAGASVDEMARRSGVNKAMLYYHVGDKQALYTAVLARNIDHVKGVLSSAIDAADGPAERLTAMLYSLTTIVREAPAYHRLVLREMASGGAHLEHEILIRFVGIVGLTRKVLDEGRAAGLFRDLNPFLIHLLLIGGVIATAAQPLRRRLIESGLFSTEASGAMPDPAAFVADVIMNGIRVPASGGVSL
ncbi:TetR/AcrR family transcriptional regulator [Candidatus Fermentibacteria bacterium]|nr:TetR/AcrR family transcriptional regulator [Candidatus Fermentibacteria bacterium]